MKTSPEKTYEEITLTETALVPSEPNEVYPSHTDEEAWTRINDQRVALIRKRLDSELTPAERQQLEQLQSAMMAHNDAIAPLPWGMIDEMEATIRQIAATKQ